MDDVCFRLQDIHSLISYTKWTIMEFIASGDIEESDNLWMAFESVKNLQNADDIVNSVLKDLIKEDYKE